jgi:putative Ca2+/H+ antiporter (TMEM165/GDT1 family)
MLEVLQLHVSGFWVWLGLTIGIAVCGQVVVLACTALASLFRTRRN